MDLNKIPENAENSKKECAVTAVLQQLVRGSSKQNLFYTKHCNVG